MKNYLIGIGGTGARVIEAAIFLSYAGLGPQEFSIIIVDPDEANGNLTRTKSLIELYKICKNNFNDLSSENFLLKTKISTASQNFVWSIFERHNYTLSDHIMYPALKTTNKNLADFVSVLFTEEELNTPLNEGFRGHPAIGSIVMSELPDEQEPWKTFWKDLNDNAKTQYSARVFIIGSLFGGTGASGIPTIGKLLKSNDKAIIEGNKNKILLGSAFALPYFTFDVPSENILENQKIKMFVTPDHFMIATKSALKYYDTKELPFDQVYLIGNYSPGKAGKFSPGSKTQENLPNYIELIMALAAFDFFNQPDVKEDQQKETKFFYAGHIEDKLSWEDIPVTRDRSQKSLKTKNFKTNLTITALFSYILATFGEKVLNIKPDEIHYTWFRDNFKKNDEFPQYIINMNAIKNIITLSNDFLWWLSSISNSDFNLFDVSKITDEKPEVGKKLSLIDPEQKEYNASLLLLRKEDRRKEKEFSKFIDILNKTKVKLKQISPASRYIELFFNASKNFANEVYNI